MSDLTTGSTVRSRLAAAVPSLALGAGEPGRWAAPNRVVYIMVEERMGLFDSLKNLPQEFRAGTSAKKLAMIADIVGILGISFMAVVSAITAQIQKGVQINFAGIFGFLLYVDAFLIFMLMAWAVLNLFRPFLTEALPMGILIYYAALGFVWLLCLLMFAALMPEALSLTLFSP